MFYTGPARRHTGLARLAAAGEAWPRNCKRMQSVMPGLPQPGNLARITAAGIAYRRGRGLSARLALNQKKKEKGVK